MAHQPVPYQTVYDAVTNALTAQGTNMLPYGADVKWQLRTQLISLALEYPTLIARTANFMHNDGRSALLFQIEGTVPMAFKGANYNIPVTIWLTENFPRGGPLVYVNPTRDMVVKKNHRHVDHNGQVTTPYLRSWVYPQSNLVDLARDLSSCFSNEPPLYSKPPQSHQQRPAEVGQQQAFSNPIHVPGVASNARPAQTMASNIRPPHTMTSTSSSPAVTENPRDVFRRNAIDQLVPRLNKDVEVQSQKLHEELEKLMKLQSQLNQRAEVLERGRRELRDEKEALESSLQFTKTNVDVLEEWLRVNKNVPAEVNADEAFAPSDVLSKQLLECTATDFMYEDVLYSLDKALKDDRVLFEVYLKTVRDISTQQFTSRATAIKIRAFQAQVPPVRIPYA